MTSNETESFLDVLPASSFHKIGPVMLVMAPLVPAIRMLEGYYEQCLESFTAWLIKSCFVLLKSPRLERRPWTVVRYGHPSHLHWKTVFISEQGICGANVSGGLANFDGHVSLAVKIQHFRRHFLICDLCPVSTTA